MNKRKMDCGGDSEMTKQVAEARKPEAAETGKQPPGERDAAETARGTAVEERAQGNGYEG